MKYYSNLARWFHDAFPYFSLSLSLDHWFFRCRHDEQVWLWQIFLARWFFPNFSRPWRGTICKILEFFFVGVKQLGNSSSCKAKCSFAILIGGLSNSFNMFFCLFAMYFFFCVFLFRSFICEKNKTSFQKLGTPTAGRPQGWRHRWEGQDHLVAWRKLTSLGLILDLIGWSTVKARCCSYICFFPKGWGVMIQIIPSKKGRFHVDAVKGVFSCR